MGDSYRDELRSKKRTSGFATRPKARGDGDREAREARSQAFKGQQSRQAVHHGKKATQARLRLIDA